MLDNEWGVMVYWILDSHPHWNALAFPAACFSVNARTHARRGGPRSGAPDWKRAANLPIMQSPMIHRWFMGLGPLVSLDLLTYSFERT